MKFATNSYCFIPIFAAGNLQVDVKNSWNCLLCLKIVRFWKWIIMSISNGDILKRNYFVVDIEFVLFQDIEKVSNQNNILLSEAKIFWKKKFMCLSAIRFYLSSSFNSAQKDLLIRGIFSLQSQANPNDFL